MHDADNDPIRPIPTSSLLYSIPSARRPLFVLHRGHYAKYCIREGLNKQEYAKHVNLVHFEAAGGCAAKHELICASDNAEEKGDHRTRLHLHHRILNNERS